MSSRAVWDYTISHGVSLHNGSSATSQERCNAELFPPLCAVTALGIPFQFNEHKLKAVVRIDEIGTMQEAIFAGIFFLRNDADACSNSWWHDRERRSYYMNGFTGFLCEGHQALNFSGHVLKNGDELHIEYDLWLGCLTFYMHGAKIGSLEGLQGDKPALAVQMCGADQCVTLLSFDIEEGEMENNEFRDLAQTQETRQPSTGEVEAMASIVQGSNSALHHPFVHSASRKSMFDAREFEAQRERILSLELEARKETESRRRAEEKLQAAEERMSELALENMSLSEELRRAKALLNQAERKYAIMRGSGSFDRLGAFQRGHSETSLLGGSSSATAAIGNSFNLSNTADFNKSDSFLAVTCE